MSVEEPETAVDTHTLRAELKSWENAFKEKNGRKPGRADIKNDATIAAKYKLYDRIARREETAPKQTPRKSNRPAEVKEDKSKHTIAATPRKTPSKDKPESLAPPTLSPAPEVEATPAYIKCALGPTPLKDGRVLGIFDVLSATPVHDRDAQRAGPETLIAGTPSKSAPASSEHAFSKTPQSQSKRNLFHAFAGTPLKRKRGDNDDVGTTSSKKRAFATPTFLRRSFPLASIDEESTETTAPRPPFRKRNLVRSLSSMIQNLKKQEDERMDEEWDILNEIEEEEQGGGEAKKKDAPKVMVQDSQAGEMPLGPDQAPVSDEDDGGAQETGRKPWKKKGLKRQTRRTNMKPVLHKAKKADDLEPWEQDSDEEVVPETQQQKGEVGDENSDSSDSDGPEKKSAKRKKQSTAKEKEKETSKSKPRKVNPDAHANYRALKIKNKNSKANGRGRRFGRR